MAVIRPLTVAWLGRIAYQDAWEIQQLLSKHHKDGLLPTPSEGPAKDTLILCEHDPVYTAGTRNRRQHLGSETEQRLGELGADFRHTNRGGLITFHGPGQLVAYPIINLTHFKKSVRWYVSQLELTIIQTCREFGVEAGTSSHTGVWVKNNKIGAIGIQCSRYITTHGLSINCNTDLTWFDHIIPCGLEDKGVTSLSVELKRDVTVQDVVPVFIKAFADKFNCSIEENRESSLLR